MCIALFKRVCHWGPLVALAIIKAVTMATVICLAQLSPPQASWRGSAVLFGFLMSAVLTLYFFLQAMWGGPGHLPKGWKPAQEEDVKYLQYCNSCQGYKAARAHHCRKCGRCVMKMDHHCPWINNCVGHHNHGSFTMFLMWAVIGSAIGAVVLSVSLYHAIHRTWYLYYGSGTEPIIYLSQWGIVICMFVLGLSIGVVLAVGMLLFFQVRGILRNRTGIEDWILEKAVHRRGPDEEPFVYPYNLGRWRNFWEVLHPFREPTGNGVTWPVVEGCNQYTLTVEQLNQKAEKRLRTRRYRAVEAYSGWWCPCTKGVCVCCHPPCTDEPRIRLVDGDALAVTRWKKYWLYGEKIIETPGCHPPPKPSGAAAPVETRTRGWFPRRCVVEEIVCHETKKRR